MRFLECAGSTALCLPLLLEPIRVESGDKPPHSKRDFAFAHHRSIIFRDVASYQIPAEFADLG